MLSTHLEQKSTVSTSALAITVISLYNYGCIVLADKSFHILHRQPHSPEEELLFSLALHAPMQHHSHQSCTADDSCHRFKCNL